MIVQFSTGNMLFWLSACPDCGIQRETLEKPERIPDHNCKGER